MENTTDISELATPPAAFKDRSTGLTVFGVLTLIFGCFAGLMVPLMIAGQAAAAKNPNVAPNNGAGILLGAGVYGGLAVAMIWMGIGSIQKRRWARALLLIFAWCWLVMGILMTVITPFIISKSLASLPPDVATGRPPMSPDMITGMVIGMTIFFFVIFVSVPALWVFFYQSRHVKATCEARDPVTRWTDACPLPVLAVSLLTWVALPMMILAAMTDLAVMPFFGMLLNGLPATILFVVYAGVWGLGGWWLYRLEVRGWWLVVAAMLVFMVSSLLTYSHHDMIEVYRLQGLPQAQIDQIQKMGLFPQNAMNIYMLLSALPALGYLLFIKKYLRKG
ncbi:MAG TPA: hypothetical protein VK742_02715 [Candidatus Sulfotelmatobacter sp.]|jgi:hypothetical protein|nr:hypothetical protein [Candidatus Sulfotelmatobacter sp.]